MFSFSEFTNEYEDKTEMALGPYLYTLDFIRQPAWNGRHTVSALNLELTAVTAKFLGKS